MNIREVSGEADIRRLVKVAREVWREANVSFCSAEQVEYMIGKFQSFEAVSGQIMQGYRYFLVEEDGAITAYFGVQPQGVDCSLASSISARRTAGGEYSRSAWDS